MNISRQHAKIAYNFSLGKVLPASFFKCMHACIISRKQFVMYNILSLQVYLS